MSRHLPQHPNLDHLKKQAKELLPELVRQNPAAQLADAQHAIAREYGFASWPKLKVYVESRPAPAESSPLAGRWTASLEKSRRHPANQFQSATLEIDVVGDSVTIVHLMVSETGKKERGTHTILADGVDRPSERGNGYVMTARWLGPNALETVATKDGARAGWGTYEVSADGSILTVSAEEQVLVLERS